MKYQSKLLKKYTFSLTLMFMLLISCSTQKNKTIFIEAYIVGENYHYNDNGFVNTPYGRASIAYKSYYKNGKLDTLFWNRANGFLPYSLEDLKNDPKIYKSFQVDSLLEKNKEKIKAYKTKTIRNDTIFYRDNEKVLIIL